MLIQTASDLSAPLPSNPQPGRSSAYFYHIFRRRNAMRFARRAQMLALVMLMLCVAASAQTLRSENDPRNQAPTVGTGGPPGGPTGLFTVYDAQTMRRGEFTLDLSYSNYDRDPGNVDITSTTSSFNVGLSDYLELFFNADHYRQIKVNNPRNLSSFYLPNSLGRVFPAVVLAPIGSGNLLGRGVFRPSNRQGFVQYPFVGGGLDLNGRLSGEVLGAQGVTGASNFGAADRFPGIGSPFGSILPGIVLSTTATLPAGSLVPLQAPGTTFAAPAYLPDAPFVNRTYGESAYSTFVVGGKIRFTEPDNALGVAIVPFYRFYGDKADDFSGFNQLQRGASPGGNIGDFGLVGVVDGRLSRSVNVSANFGYVLNSNPTANFAATSVVAGQSAGGGELTLLDRPDELLAGIAFDFPVNRYFQPIAELRTTRYVGGRTPNSLENNPIDGLIGVRVFPRRFFGFSAAYRRHLNQQDPDTALTGFVNSTDPDGFLFQFFAGRRNERAPEVLPNQPPTVTLSASPTDVVVCAEDPTRADPSNSQVQLTTTATDPDGDTLLYTYTTTGGRIVGEGPNVTLDLTGVQPGSYTVTAEVDDGCGCVAFSTTTVNVAACPDITPECPTVSLNCPEQVEAGQSATLTASVSNGDPNITPTFNWTVTSGTITSGQGTPTITVDTQGATGSITATVDVGGFAASCPTSASCTVNVNPKEVEVLARKVDEFGKIPNDDEKARFDNYAIELQSDPQATATIVTYGGRVGRAGEAQARADRARNYLVNERQIDASRITTVDGGFREEASTELYIVPAGAQQPTASPNVDASEVRSTPARRAPRRRARRR
jgi:hypothetical protein